MPHSSGGGSSSGGSHGSDSGSSQSTRCSHRYFPGAQRYVYYDRYGTEQYVYCNKDPASRPFLSWLQVLVLLPLLLLSYVGMQQMLVPPERIENPSASILIEDTLDVIEDQDQLQATLSRFYEETGVTPAVLTVTHESWQDRYEDLEAYALQAYLDRFSDEKHWLIVYSLPSAALEGPRTALHLADWKFEGMIGDDADSVSDRMCSRFTEQTQENLAAAGDPGQAIGRSFSYVLANRQSIRRTDFFTNLAIGIVMTLLFAIPIFSSVREILWHRKYKRAVRDSL